MQGSPPGQGSSRSTRAQAVFDGLLAQHFSWTNSNGIEATLKDNPRSNAVLLGRHGSLFNITKATLLVGISSPK